MLGSIFRNMLTMLTELGIYTEDAEHLFASRLKGNKSPHNNNRALHKTPTNNESNSIQ